MRIVYERKYAKERSSRSCLVNLLQLAEYMASPGRESAEEKYLTSMSRSSIPGVCGLTFAPLPSCSVVWQVHSSLRVHRPGATAEDPMFQQSVIYIRLSLLRSLFSRGPFIFLSNAKRSHNRAEREKGKRRHDVLRLGLLLLRWTLVIMIIPIALWLRGRTNCPGRVYRRHGSSATGR